MPRPVALLAIVLVLVPAAPASAQLRFAGGANLSDFFGSDAGANERRSGLDLGMTIPLFRIGPAQLLAEGYYRQKGARSVEEFQQAALEGRSIDVGIDYAEVPVLLRVSLPSLGQRVFPWVQGGPAFAWRINCGLSFDATASRSTSSCDDLNGENIEQTLHDYERGLVLGAGIDVPILQIGSIAIDARYTRGLSRLGEDGEVRNRALSVMLGYSFGVPFGFGGRDRPPVMVR